MDLRSSSSDPLLPDLLERRPPEQLDQLNETRRMEGRKGGLLGLYASYIDDEEAVEKRIQAEPPSEIIGHRILVNCLDLRYKTILFIKYKYENFIKQYMTSIFRLELEVEPIFASMAIYDAKEKKKVSENFYFDMNSDSIKHMLSSHVTNCDMSTLSRSAVFDITHPTPDLFLVIRLEKVLQGDITECAEPYIKDDKVYSVLIFNLYALFLSIITILLYRIGIKCDLELLLLANDLANTECHLHGQLYTS